MFQFIEFLKKRPSDTTIRIIRILFSLGTAGLLVLAAKDYSLPFQSHYESFALYAKYALAAVFVIHAVVFGAIGICFCKRSLMKKLQMIVGVLMIITGNFIGKVEAPTPQATPNTQVSISAIATETPKPINVGFYFALLGFLPLLSGISGKMIMSKCLKHGETITKIRV